MPKTAREMEKIIRKDDGNTLGRTDRTGITSIQPSRVK